MERPMAKDSWLLHNLESDFDKKRTMHRSKNIFSRGSVSPVSIISSTISHRNESKHTVNDDLHIKSRIGDSKQNGTDASGMETSECLADGLLQFVKPALECCYWTFMTPSKYRYDCEMRTHVRIDGGIPRKVVTFLLQISSLFYLWNNTQRLTSSALVQNSEFGLIYRIMYASFALLAASFYWILWNNSYCIKWLLGRIEELALELLKDRHCKLPSPHHVKYSVWGLLAISSGYSLSYTIVKITRGNMFDLSSPVVFLRRLAYEAEINLHYGTGLLQEPTNTTGGQYGAVAAALIGIPYFIIEQYQTMTWISAFIMILLWAALFRTILKTYFASLNKYRTTQQFKLRYIRIFHKITILIEDYNRIFALNTLFSIVSCLLYLPVSASSVFTSFRSNIVLHVMTVLAFVPLLTLLIVCSEVNSMANQMSMIVKIYYQQKKLWRLTIHNSDSGSGGGSESSRSKAQEISQGLGMIQHDLQAGAIGFKGYGFFTISYSFMGTVISVMITYSVMFHQWMGSAGL